MAKGGTQPQTVTQTSSSEPWGAQQPFLKFGFEEAKNLYEDPARLEFYPGQTFAGPSQETLQGLTGLAERARAGSPVLAAAQGEAEKVLSGAYLDPAQNPGFQTAVNRIRANVLPGIDSRFIAAGRPGSGLHGRAVGEGLGDAIGSLVYGDYKTERDRMGTTMAGAPALAQADYADPLALIQAGQQREAIGQKPISEAIARHEFEQMSPYDELARYMASVTGNYGGTTTGTTTQYLQQANPWMQGLGLALSGAGALGSIFSSDERLKEDIDPIGTTNEGANIYAFRYKGERGPHGEKGPRRIGVMAQEMLQRKPEAVLFDPSGFLAVDYEMVA